MKANRISRATIALLFAAFTCMGKTRPALAQGENVLYNFCALSGCADGSTPVSPVIKDAEGNLYGTTYFGGAFNSGTVFKLSPGGTLTVLHSFGGGSTDGSQPSGALARDTKGNLYGTTVTGGANRSGTVFKLNPAGTETILHSFGANTSDGLYPAAGLTIDAEGNLYGTTPNGGKGFGAGTVFKVGANGSYTILHAFSGAPDGLTPVAPVVLDQHGNLYGTTKYGGAAGVGTVFTISSVGTEAVLYGFKIADGDKGNGVFPDGGLVVDAEGNLYGTTFDGGAFHCGVAFKLAPDGTETVLHSFGGAGDGLHTQSGLVMDGQGNLYGTTFQGGEYGYGIVFELGPTGTETILHSFDGSDGAAPEGGLLIDSLGNLYGTSSSGGAGDEGTVFEITP